jgi:hypothetical protein
MHRFSLSVVVFVLLVSSAAYWNSSSSSSSTVSNEQSQSCSLTYPSIESIVITIENRLAARVEVVISPPHSKRVVKAIVAVIFLFYSIFVLYSALFLLQITIEAAVHSYQKLLSSKQPKLESDDRSSKAAIAV